MINANGNVNRVNKNITYSVSLPGCEAEALYAAAKPRTRSQLSDTIY